MFKNKIQKTTKNIKLFFKGRIDVFGYEEKIEELELEVKRLKEKKPKAKDVVAEIFDGNVKWFSTENMTKEKSRNYFKDCQRILSSEAFNNVKNYLYATVAIERIKQHNPTIGVDTTRDIQMIYNGIELLVENLEDVLDPDQEDKPKETNTDPNRLLNY